MNVIWGFLLHLSQVFHVQNMYEVLINEVCNAIFKNF